MHLITSQRERLRLTRLRQLSMSPVFPMGFMTPFEFLSSVVSNSKWGPSSDTAAALPESVLTTAFSTPEMGHLGKIPLVLSN